MDFKHLDITDLPSDPNGSLGQVRRSVMRAYNENRNSPDKLRLLSDTLVHIVGMIEVGFDTIAEHEKTAAMKNQEKIDAALPEVETPVVNPRRTIKRRKPTTKD